MMKEKTKQELFWQNSNTIPLLKQSLEQGSISITSTDTIYGFLGTITQQSINAINQLKNTPHPRPFIVLITTANLSLFVDTKKLTANMKNVIDHCWPGPLTIIFNAKPSVPSFLKSNKNTIALRCPDHTGLQKLLAHFNGLCSTSANKTMDPPPTKATDIDPNLIQKTDYLVHDIEKGKTISLASSIIDFSQVDYPVLTIVREGAFPKEKLEKYYYEAQKNE